VDICKKQKTKNMWENIYTKKTISDYEYIKLFHTEKRKWRKVNTNSNTSLFSETTTTAPGTTSWIDSTDNFSNNDNSWSNDSSSTSTDFGGGDFGGGGAGGDW
jgi:uncharacterized membrane protein YgcG